MCRRSCCDLWKYVICWCFYDNDDDPFDVHAILHWGDQLTTDKELYGASI